MSKLTGKYQVSELLKADLKGSDPLIDRVLFERDNTILLGKEKAGKSILSIQMACALSYGGKFLGEYDVPKACDVVYIQAEGKLANTRDNFKNMTRVIDADLERILLLYYPSIALDTQSGYDEILTQIASWKKPEVIFIDPLYMAMKGDLKDDVASRQMVENLRKLGEIYDATIIIVHHAHRDQRKDGVVIYEGDNSIFGSFVWKAFPYQVLMIEKVQGHKNYRKLSCATQRMGNVIESLDLVLIEPTPIYFEKRTDGRPIDELVFQNVATDGSTVADISQRVGRHYEQVLSAIHRLQHVGKVRRTNPSKNPGRYAKD